jgi:hypothetical protein
VAHAGRGREKGELGRARRGFGLLSLLPSPFLFFFYTQLFKQNYLNSNKFEFKSYKLNTRKNNASAWMHKHVDLIIDFIFLCYKLL